MSRLVQCDRCKNQYKVHSPNYADNWQGQELTLSGGFDAELCHNCVKELKQWIQTPNKVVPNV